MEEILKEVCINMIKLLGELKDLNKISQQEYENHIRMKVEFLSRT